MMTPDPKMLEAFDRFLTSMVTGYDTVRRQLERCEFTQAHDTLAKLSRVHAQNTVSLRNYLIKRNLLEGDD